MRSSPKVPFRNLEGNHHSPVEKCRQTNGGPSPPTDLSASHPVLSRQWREWCTTVYTTYPRQEDGFATNRLASTSYAHVKTKSLESCKPSATLPDRQNTTQPDDSRYLLKSLRSCLKRKTAACSIIYGPSDPLRPLVA